MTCMARIGLTILFYFILLYSFICCKIANSFWFYSFYFRFLLFDKRIGVADQLLQRHAHSKKASKNILGKKRLTWLHTWEERILQRKGWGILISEKKGKWNKGKWISFSRLSFWEADTNIYIYIYIKKKRKRGFSETSFHRKRYEARESEGKDLRIQNQWRFFENINQWRFSRQKAALIGTFTVDSFFIPIIILLCINLH